MCGRYAQGRAINELISRYAQLGAMIVASEQGFAPGFNIAPSLFAAVVFREADEVGIAPMRWGLVPRWAKSLDALKSKPINARSETAADSPMFRDAFRSCRCLVPAMGFYEWQGDKPPKQPYFIHVKGESILSFAGLWSRWKDPTGGDLLTYTILTTSANETVRPIHDRMPCILRREEEAEWLAPETGPERVSALLRPYASEDTIAYRVSRAVNKPGGGGPELIEPLAELFP